MILKMDWIFEKIEKDLKKIDNATERLAYLFESRNKYDDDFWGKDRYEKILRKIDTIIAREKSLLDISENRDYDRNTIKIEEDDLKNLNNIGIINIIKNKYPRLANSEYNLNIVLNEIVNNKPPNYKYRIGLLIRFGVIDAIKEKLKPSPVNPNQIATKLKPIFDFKQTSIEPIIRAYENKDYESKKYPYTEQVQEQIQQKLSKLDLLNKQ